MSLTPDARVRMADGSERAIAGVKLLEEVVTADGRSAQVTQMTAQEGKATLMRLVIWGHSHLRITSGHPVLTARGYVPAGELLAGDEVAFPKYVNGAMKSVPVEQFVTKASHRLTRGNRWSGPPGRKGLQVGANILPEAITLDEPTGRLLGLFLAEGSCDASKARWTFAKGEADTLVAETVRLISDCWGVEAHVAHRPNNSINVTVYGTGWALLLSALCGNGSGMKCPRSELMSGSREFLAAMLSGWIAGDGHHRKDGSDSAVTISADLAMAMYDIAQALGQHPNILWAKPVMNSAAATRQPTWTLTMAPGPGRCRETESHVWRKVRRIESEDYTGPMYDLSVEDGESYAAEGVGVRAAP